MAPATIRLQVGQATRTPDPGDAASGRDILHSYANPGTGGGATVTEHPEPGEVIWRDDDGVTRRCWNWRQCVRTRITEATTSAMFILDGLAELGPDGLAAAGRDLAGQLVALHPGAGLSWRQVGARTRGAAGPGPAGTAPGR